MKFFAIEFQPFIFIIYRLDFLHNNFISLSYPIAFYFPKFQHLIFKFILNNLKLIFLGIYINKFLYFIFNFILL